MIAISEIFGPTIQGEGALLGVPTIFVRTGGCDFRCSWCDTLYAVDPAFKKQWREMSSEEVLAAVKHLNDGQPILITLSGGNPALQPLQELIQLGHQQGFTFAMETQASKACDWFSHLDHLCLSPKPPSSGMGLRRDRLDACLNAAGANTQLSLKLVIADEIDYQWAKALAAEYPQLPVYLQPCNPAPATPDEPDRQTDLHALNNRYRWLIERTLSDHWYNVRITPQLHVLVWNNERGV